MRESPDPTEPLGEHVEIRVSNVDKKVTPGQRPVRLCNYMDAYTTPYLGGRRDYMKATADHGEILRFGLQAGDVVITKDSETPDDIGVAAVIDDASGDPPLVCGYHLAILRPTTVDPVFLAKQLGHDRIKAYFGKVATGSTRYGLSNGAIHNVPLFTPPKPEQERVAAILRTLDDAIRSTEQVIAKLENVKRGLLHDLLTRGIDDNGEIRDPERHPEQFKDSPLGRIPVGWSVQLLREAATFLTSGSRGWARYYAETGALFLRIGNLTREHINLRLDDLQHVRPPAGGEGSRTRVETGDLLISITADLGIIGSVPPWLGEAYVNQHIALMRPDPTAANPRWLSHFLAGPTGQRSIRRANDQGAKAGLNLPTVSSFRVALPARHEQDRLVAVLDAHDGRIEREIKGANKLHLLKKGLADDLLTGRVRVVNRGASG
jgi:type I restriction enzyme S subunit